MALLGTNLYDITRPNAPTKVKGKYTPSAPTTISDVAISIQPLTGKEYDNLPTNLRERDVEKAYSETQLMLKDQLTYNSDLYEVVKVFNWTTLGFLNHYKVYIGRVENQ